MQLHIPCTVEQPAIRALTACRSNFSVRYGVIQSMVAGSSMSAALVFAVFAVTLIAATVFYLFFYRAWRRERELRAPFSTSRREHLDANVPLYRRLPEALKQTLEQRVQLFLSEKEFYGCDGFEVDDAVRVTIAGHACLLILARPYSDFDEVSCSASSLACNSSLVRCSTRDSSRSFSSSSAFTSWMRRRFNRNTNTKKALNTKIVMAAL